MASHTPDSRCPRVTVACGLVPPIDTAASAEERSLIETDGKVMHRSLVVPLGQEPPRLIGDDIPTIPVYGIGRVSPPMVLRHDSDEELITLAAD